MGGYLLFPTHIVRKGNEIVGSFCLYSPTVYWWMHSGKTKVRDTLSVYQTLSALLANEGVLDFILPVEPESPNFHFLSNKLNYLPSVVGNDFKLFLNKG